MVTRLHLIGFVDLYAPHTYTHTHSAIYMHSNVQTSSARPTCAEWSTPGSWLCYEGCTKQEESFSVFSHTEQCVALFDHGLIPLLTKNTQSLVWLSGAITRPFVSAPLQRAIINPLQLYVEDEWDEVTEDLALKKKQNPWTNSHRDRVKDWARRKTQFSTIRIRLRM